MSDIKQLAFDNYSSSTLSSGVYYRLVPKATGAASFISGGGDPMYFPVTTEVGLGVTHTWNEGDNYAKNMLQTVGKAVGIPDAIGDFGSRMITRIAGGGVHVSAPSVYVDTSPPTINVSTKLISVDGKGNVLKILDRLYKETTCILFGGTMGGMKGGLVAHPGWWDIEIVGGGKALVKMKDMMCISINITMHTPFVNGGKEPCVTDLTMAFKHGFRGTDGTVKIGD